MSKVTIEKLQNKHKIHIEYSTKIGISFANIVPERDDVVVSVLLKNHTQPIASNDIKWISISAKPDKEKKT